MTVADRNKRRKANHKARMLLEPVARDHLGRPLTRRYAAERPGGPKQVDTDPAGEPIMERPSPFGYRVRCPLGVADAERRLDAPKAPKASKAERKPVPKARTPVHRVPVPTVGPAAKARKAAEAKAKAPRPRKIAEK